MATLNECSAVREGVNALEQYLARSRVLQQQSLNDPDTSANTRTNRELNSIDADARTLRANLAGRIQRLKGKNDYEQYRSQILSVERSMNDILQKTLAADSEYRKKMIEQNARQIRIVDPGLSDEEIWEKAEDTSQLKTFADKVSCCQHLSHVVV